MQAALFQKYGLDKISSDDVLAIFDEKIAVNVVPIKEEKQEGGKR